jgi:eukaryotic-like serine/threonine-protein kinase
MDGRAGQTVAGYRLIRLLGEGAQSRVFLAWAPGQGPVVALKLTPLGPAATEAQARAFMASACAARVLQHPNVAAVLDAGVEGTTGWLAMEAVPGCDLTRYTRAPRLLPEAVVLDLCAQIAEGLAHAHGRGLAHRDVKPANVLVDWAARQVKLVDFGLARAADGANTGTGIVPGTPTYMAPELLAGGLPSAASDLYALGAMLFELLCGAPPFAEASLGRFLQQVSQQPAPAPEAVRPGLPASLLPGLKPLLSGLLAKTARERPQDAAEVAARLRVLAQAAHEPAARVAGDTP